MAYIRAAQTGNYSDTNTWVGGVIPGISDTAHAGSFSVTIDVPSVGTLDSRNSAWVAAGGTSLAAAHTGKFIMQPGSTLSVVEIISSGYSSATTGKTLEVTNGVLTVGTLSRLEGSGSASAGIRATPTGSLSITISNSIPVDNAISGTDLLYVAASNASTLTFNIEGISIVGGTVPSSGGTNVVRIMGTATSSTLTLSGPVFGNSYSTGGFTTLEYSLVSSLGNTINLPQEVTTTISGHNIAIRIAEAKDIFAPNGLTLRGNGATSPSSQTLTISKITNLFLVTGDATFYDSVGMSIGAGTAGGQMQVTGDFIVDKTNTEGSSSQFAIYLTKLTVDGKFRYIGHQSLTTINTSGVFNLNTSPVEYVFTQGMVASGKLRSPVFRSSIAGSNNFKLTSGTVDFSPAYAQTPTNSALIYMTTLGFSSITINGDVIPPSAGENAGTAVTDSFINIQSATHQPTSGQFTVTGTVYGSSYRKTIKLGSSTQTGIVTAPSFNIIRGYATAGVSPSTVNITVDNFFAPASVNQIIQGDNVSQFPVSGYFKITNTSNTPLSIGGSSGMVTLYRVDGAVPSPGDVRFGVPVGNTVGTYQLSDSYLASIQQLRTLALAIKAKSDQMTFDGTNIEANIPSTGNLISNNIQAIKTQTDKMAFETIVTPPLDGDSDYINVNVLLHGSEIISGGTITDGKSNTFTVNGGVTTSTTNIGILSNNLYFDGNGDYLNISKVSAIGTGDFTIEARIYSTTTGDDREIFAIGGSSNSNLLLEISSTNTVRFLVRNSSATNIDISTTTQIALNTWNSIAATVSGTTARIFINGVLSATGTLTGTRQNDETNLKIGALATNVNRFFAGHMEELRITKGVARYVSDYTVATIQFPNSATSTPGSTVTKIIASGTSSGTGGTTDCDLTPITSQLSSISTTLGTIGTNITGVSTATTAIKTKTDQLGFINGEVISSPSNSADVTAIKAQTDKMQFETTVTQSSPPDTYWGSVIVLLKGEGTPGSQTITNEKIKQPTVFGETFLSTVNKKFGQSSIRFDGVGDYLSFTGSDSPINILSSDYTFECWIYLDQINTTTQSIFTLPGVPAELVITGTGSSPGANKVGLYKSGYVLVTANTLSATTWYHIAISRISGVTRLFVDGISAGTTSSFSDSISGDLIIGAWSSTQEFFKGYMDEVRITSGVGRYSADFTPPIAEFGTSVDGTSGSSTTKIIASGGTGGSCDLTNIESGLLAVKTKTDQLSFSSGKVIADASVIDYTSQLSAITSTVNAISDAVDLIDAVTSKIAFETVYSEGDPNLAQVIFKAEFNGTNGSTTINADTGQIGTNQGSPSLNTAYTRTGTSSVALSGSIVSYGNISSLNLGANDFTIEFSVNFSSIVSTVGDYAGVVGKRASNGDFSWICYVTEGKMNFLTSGTSAVSIAHPTTLSPATWYDVAVSRTGDILKFYVNGVLSQVSCTGMNMTTTTAPFFIGRLSYDISSYHMFGYLDRLRITVGTGRYNSVAPVSPPVSEYPTTLNGIAQSYKVVANCDSGTTIPTDLTDRLTDLRNRINAIHFIVKDE